MPIVNLNLKLQNKLTFLLITNMAALIIRIIMTNLNSADTFPLYETFPYAFAKISLLHNLSHKHCTCAQNVP